MAQSFATQIITLLALLALLLGVLFYVKRNQSSLRARFGNDGPIQIKTTTALTPNDRAHVIAVHGQEYLVVTSARASASVTPILAEGAE